MLSTMLGNRIPYHRRFKFENHWLLEEELEEVVTSSWPAGTSKVIESKIDLCTSSLDGWGRKISRWFREDISRCKHHLEDLCSCDDDSAIQQFISLKDQLARLLVQEETYWKQRAKAHWLKDGDSNTKYFHAATSTRKKRNAPTSLKNDDGQDVNSQQGLCQLAHGYFTTLFAEHPSDTQAVTELLVPKISVADNDFLTQRFTEEKLRDGSDGLNAALS